MAITPAILGIDFSGFPSVGKRLMCRWARNNEQRIVKTRFTSSFKEKVSALFKDSCFRQKRSASTSKSAICGRHVVKRTIARHFTSVLWCHHCKMIITSYYKLFYYAVCVWRSLNLFIGHCCARCKLTFFLRQTGFFQS